MAHFIIVYNTFFGLFVVLVKRFDDLSLFLLKLSLKRRKAGVF